MDAEKIQHELEEIEEYMLHPHEPFYESYEVFSDIKTTLQHQLARTAKIGIEISSS